MCVGGKVVRGRCGRKKVTARKGFGMTIAWQNDPGRSVSKIPMLFSARNKPNKRPAQMSTQKKKCVARWVSLFHFVYAKIVF